ncbi:hypothetical protein B0G77_5544 [Paraburkholderia sp. BL10I2N1]|nr:hypothetical protein B0G77_5544 [Paraburkholderia sp. BL10I2N1]
MKKPIHLTVVMRLPSLRANEFTASATGLVVNSSSRPPLAAAARN